MIAPATNLSIFETEVINFPDLIPMSEKHTQDLQILLVIEVDLTTVLMHCSYMPSTLFLP